jgi:uncharacterized protein
MKRVMDWAGIVLTAVLCAPIAYAEKLAAMPQPSGYVDDYAGVMSAPAKAEIEAECRELHDKTKAQVFFVTIKTLDGEAVETFANELFAKWKIGEKKTDRGVLLLLSVKEHKRWIEIGYGLEGILPDGKVGDIGREMVPALKASNYDEAARIGVRDVSAVFAADAGVTLGGAEPLNAVAPPVPAQITPSSEGPVWVLLMFPLFFLMFFGVMIWGAVVNRRRGLGGGRYYVPGPGIGYVPGPGMNLGNNVGNDGGNIGGSSFDGGSSGSSFGGGDSGGSFSGGDGGSSGGGGAGGDW